MRHLSSGKSDHELETSTVGPLYAEADSMIINKIASLFGVVSFSFENQANFF